MTPASLAILLFAVAVILLLAEALLPTHGLLGAMAAVSLLAAVVICFRINARFGFGVLVATVVAAPFVATWAASVWPRTAVGRRLVLTAVTPAPVPVAHAITVGQRGVAVSALRPMGEVDFGDLRLEAISDHGMINPGQPVVVLSVANGRPTVRPAGTVGTP
jgi:membrane-bound serine protease (ClpP class)